jgi:phospholipid/cholesterol/gamma-HCH transport system substrate-binding protein
VPAVTRRQRVVTGIVVAGAIALIALAFSALTSGSRSITITADFAEAPGLFAGNHVDVLGIPVGSVTSIRPQPDHVLITMRLPASVPVPEGATASLMAPDVVNDRYIQLSPAYSGGPKLADHAHLTLASTRSPVTPDEIISTLDQLVRALGPNGANKNGALSDLLHNLAQSFQNTGPDFKATVVNLSQALGALASNKPSQVTDVLNNLGKLTQGMADNTTTYQSFANDLSAVSGSLAADNSDIGKALSSLQTVLGQLASFLQTNQGALGSSITNLQTFASALAQQQQQLAQVYNVAPLSLQNLHYAVDPTNTQGCPAGQKTCAAIRARFDPVANSKNLVQQVCGNQLYRGLLIATNPGQATMLDLDCAVNGSLAALTVPPGASTGPTLDLSALLRGAP